MLLESGSPARNILVPNYVPGGKTVGSPVARVDYKECLIMSCQGKNIPRNIQSFMDFS